MATLSARSRKAIPKKSFGLPSKAGSAGAKAKSGNYPMPDRSHAANAKARAAQQLRAGNLSSDQYHRIVGRANRKLGKKGR